MTKEIENFIGVYRVINEMGAAISDGRWQDVESLFADDAALHHPMAGEMVGAKNIAAYLISNVDNRIAAHYVAGNIRIQPSDGDTVHADWDLSVTLIYPGKGEDPLVFSSGSRFAGDFRRIAGRWRIANLTPAVLWMDPEMSRFVAARMAKSKG